MAVLQPGWYNLSERFAPEVWEFLRGLVMQFPEGVTMQVNRNKLLWLRWLVQQGRIGGREDGMKR